MVLTRADPHASKLLPLPWQSTVSPVFERFFYGLIAERKEMFHRLRHKKSQDDKEQVKKLCSSMVVNSSQNQHI